MSRKRLVWLAVAVTLTILVAYQTVASAGQRAGVLQIPLRIRGFDYRRTAFGDSWTDDNPAPGGHNGCDTRNDVLDRDLVDKTYVTIKRCPTAVATGTLHDPYTNETIAFVRGNQIGASVQIDHIVSAAATSRGDIYAGQSIDDMPLTSQSELA